MKTPETSRLFTKRINEKNGVEYYVLTERVATYQQGFYFVNNSFAADNRYLWFYASFPPVYDGDLRKLGVIDFETDEIYLCNDTLFNSTSPYIDPETGDVYFTWKNAVYMRGPQKEAKTVMLCELQTEKNVRHMSTHLTKPAGETEFFVEICEGNSEFYVGTINYKTGEFKKWAESKYLLNHGQLNPVNPDLVLCAHDIFDNLITGEVMPIPFDKKGVYQRLWTITRDGVKTCHAPRNNYATHEWWSHDGKKIYYVNDLGIQRLNLETGEHICVHQCYPWHAFSSKDESFYIFDEKVHDEFAQWYRGCASTVKFYNAETDKEIDVVTRMPSNGFTPDNQCRYHIDPHPRITDDEKYIVFTTTELGGADLAVAPIEQLLKKTEK